MENQTVFILFAGERSGNFKTSILDRQENRVWGVKEKAKLKPENMPKRNDHMFVKFSGESAYAYMIQVLRTYSVKNENLIKIHETDDEIKLLKLFNTSLSLLIKLIYLYPFSLGD